MSTKQNTKPSKVVTVELSASAQLESVGKLAVVVAAESIARQSCMDIAKVEIPKLHSAGVVIGRRNDKNPQKACVLATAFYDGLVSAGIAVKTANNYLTMLRDAVSTGRVPKDWNKHRKGKKTREEKDFATMLATVAKHDDGVPFAEFLTWLELAFEDAQYESLLSAFDDYLAMHGEQ